MSGRDGIAVAAVLAILLAGLPLIKTAISRFGASAEVARKSVHMAMGMICLAFPWIFQGPAAVWLLAALATIPLLILRLVPSLRHGIGSALHGIKRPSYGEVCFAPAVAAVFHLSGGDPVLFAIPIGILTWADAAGALAGTRWGIHRYGCGEGMKSIEGSAIFFFTAFLCAFLPLGLSETTTWPEAALISLIIGLLAMMAEGLADRGFDNLLIPLGVFFVLDRLLALEFSSLAWRCVVAVFFLILVLSGSRWSTMSGGALLGAALLGYGCVALADPRYVLPPVAVFICHLAVIRKHRLSGEFDHRLDAVLSHAIGCLPWVLLAERGFIDFSTGLAGVAFAMAAQLGFLEMATHWWLHGKPAPLPKALVKGWCFAASPGLIWLLPQGPRLLIPIAVALATTSLAIFLFRNIRPRPCHPTRIWMAKGVVALLSSAPALILIR